MKEQTHNAGHIFALALICFLSWRNSHLSIEEFSLRSEIAELKNEASKTLTKLDELEQTAVDIADLSVKIDQRDFTSSQFVLAQHNPAATATPVVADEHEHDEGCFHEAWSGEAYNAQLAKRLAAVQERFKQLSGMLTKVNVNMEERKVALEAVPTILPVDGDISSPFGVRRKPGTKKVFRMHRGVDIKAPRGTPVRSTAYGVVEQVERNGTYGLFLTVSHGNDIKTRYAHNSAAKVKKGDAVAKGQIIAEVGRSGRATGDHCHYEVLLDGVPVNPELFLIDRSRMIDSTVPKQVYVSGHKLEPQQGLLNRRL